MVSPFGDLFHRNKKKEAPQKRTPDNWNKRLRVDQSLAKDITLVAEVEKTDFRKAGLSLLVMGE